MIPECLKDHYWDAAASNLNGSTPAEICKECPFGAVCPQATILESLIIKEGYFRFDLESKEVYPCSPVEEKSELICKGTNQSLCGDGYTG